MSLLYNRILLWKEDHKLSIYAIEKGSDLTVGTINKWDTSIPAGDKILKVANFLDISVDYLLGNTDNPKSHKNCKEDMLVIEDDLTVAIEKMLKIQKTLETYKVENN